MCQARLVKVRQIRKWLGLTVCRGDSQLGWQTVAEDNKKTKVKYTLKKFFERHLQALDSISALKVTSYPRTVGEFFTDNSKGRMAT